MAGPVHHPFDVTRSSKGQGQQRKLVLAVGGACRGRSPYCSHSHCLGIELSAPAVLTTQGSALGKTRRRKS